MKISIEEDDAHNFMLSVDSTNTPTSIESDHDDYFRDEWAFDCEEKIPYWIWVKEQFLKNN